MIIVSNTTPILSLYKINQLQLLKILFDNVIVPRAVYNEIAVLGKNKPASDVFELADYIEVQDVSSRLAVNLLQSQLDYGEAEAIVLAREIDADLLILDEKKARKIAQANSQNIIGTIGILQLAKDRELISAMKPQLDYLIANNIWIDNKLYQIILRNNNEI